MSSAFLKNMYLQMLLSIKQISANGKASIAKPMFILSIFHGIDEGIVKDNKIYYKDVEVLFKDKCSNYADGYIPNYYYPFYFLVSDGFYHLKWRGEEKRNDAPSAKFLRDNVEYGYFDEELWELLQDGEVRQEYSKAIMNRYLNLKQ